MNRWLVWAVLAAGVSSVRADIVLQWNIYARETIKRDSANPNPGWSGRAFGMMNGAIYDCFQAVHRTHEPFLVDRVASPTASVAAATTEAAYRILVDAYPGESSWLLWAYSYNMSLIPAGAGKAEGTLLGEEVAAAYLAWRENDGSESSVPYEPSGLPGRWRPDPLNPTQEPWGPEWGAVKTFALQASDQFPVPPVPALTSSEYVAAFDEVRDFGARLSPVRTADQLNVGLFWAYDRSGLGPPPVLYFRNLHEIAVQRGNTEAENARLFAMAGVAMADAATAAWDAKFRDDCWRPITGIREADTDGNPATAPDPSWTPQGCPGGGIVPDFTPAFPAYPSGHATFGQAVFTVLKRFYGTDAVSFTLTSEELPGQPRQYTSFSQAAQENADSRVWLGVHWRFDQTAGQALGESIADYIADTRFEPVAAPGEDLMWMLRGAEAGSGYTPVVKEGAYTINGRYEVRVASDFLRGLTPTHTFDVLVAGGPLLGLPVNAAGGRLATADGYGSFRIGIVGSTLVLDDFQLAPGVLETFETFAAAHGVAADPDADPDGDGRGNFAEYAFGTAPATADKPPLVAREIIDGQEVLIVRYLRRPGRELAGLSVEAQRSEDLADWNTQGVTDEVDPDAAPVAGAEPRRAWFRIDATSIGFLRLWARLE